MPRLYKIFIVNGKEGTDYKSAPARFIITLSPSARIKVSYSDKGMNLLLARICNPCHCHYHARIANPREQAHLLICQAESLKSK